jgi:hypothetical protein
MQHFTDNFLIFNANITRYNQHNVRGTPEMDIRATRWNVSVFLITITGFFLIALPAATAAEDRCGGIGDKIAHGGILWTENAIVVQGTAAPNLSDPYKPVSAIKRDAQRAATLDAYRKIAEVLAGVSITSDSLAADNLKVVTRIQAYVPQPRICKTKYYADGGVDIVVMAPLDGKLAKALLPDAGTKVAASTSKFTGLIVDATDLPFTPALSPRLLTPGGLVLFSQENLKIEVVQAGQPVKYVHSAAAITKEMVGHSPLRVKAVALGTLAPSDLILEPNTAAELQNSPAYLGDGKVVIITPAPRRIECEDLYAKVDDRLIDWERKIALARGFGRIDFSGKQDDAVRLRMMERAAEVDAQRKLLEILLEVKIDGKKQLKNTAGASRHVQGVVRNAVRCGAKYYRDGTAEIVLAAPIDGMATKGADLGRSAPKPLVTETDLGATGLIINAYGLKFEPVLSPELLTSDGTLLYSQADAARGWVQKYGVAGYHPSVAAAKSDPRVGDKPVIVDADRVHGSPNRLVLSAEDRNKINQIKTMTGPFRQSRVVIVTENLAVR